MLTFNMLFCLLSPVAPRNIQEEEDDNTKDWLLSLTLVCDGWGEGVDEMMMST
jgi:hypothetical protein